MTYYYIKNFREGDNLLKKLSYPAAEKKFRKCISIYPQIVDSHIKLALCISKTDGLEKALAILKNAIDSVENESEQELVGEFINNLCKEHKKLNGERIIEFLLSYFSINSSRRIHKILKKNCSRGIKLFPKVAQYKFYSGLIAFIENDYKTAYEFFNNYLSQKDCFEIKYYLFLTQILGKINTDSLNKLVGFYEDNYNNLDVNLSLRLDILLYHYLTHFGKSSEEKRKIMSLKARIYKRYFKREIVFDYSIDQHFQDQNNGFSTKILSKGSLYFGSGIKHTNTIVLSEEKTRFSDFTRIYSSKFKNNKHLFVSTRRFFDTSLFFSDKKTVICTWKNVWVNEHGMILCNNKLYAGSDTSFIYNLTKNSYKLKKDTEDYPYSYEEYLDLSCIEEYGTKEEVFYALNYIDLEEWLVENFTRIIYVNDVLKKKTCKFLVPEVFKAVIEKIGDLYNIKPNRFIYFTYLKNRIRFKKLYSLNFFPEKYGYFKNECIFLSSEIIQSIPSLFVNNKIDSIKLVFLSISDYFVEEKRLIIDYLLTKYVGQLEILCKDNDETSRIKILGNADVVIGLNGADFLNVIWCSPKTKVIDLCTPSSYEKKYAQLALARNCRYWKIELKQDDNNKIIINNLEKYIEDILSDSYVPFRIKFRDKK